MITPFGDSDGAKVANKDVIHEFITFEDPRYSHSIGMGNESLDVTAIVGPKGSGKTLFLRRLRTIAATNPSYYAADIKEDITATDLVVRATEFFKVEPEGELWILLWNRAMLRSILSYLLFGKVASEAAETATKGVAELPSKFLPRAKTPCSIYNQATELLFGNDSPAIVNYLRNPVWTDIEAVIHSALHHAKPMYFFLDSLDDTFAAAPRHWLECQRALFEHAVRIMRYSELSARVHYILTIRDVVYSSILSGEHQTRFIGDKHIRILNWDYDSIRAFLESKLRRLSPDHLMNPRGTGTIIERWLGFDKIENESRGILEDATDYIIRHTRLLPRDVIIMGNRITDRIWKEKIEGRGLTQAAVRESVSHSANRFGVEQLSICSNEMAALNLPHEAAVRGHIEFYNDNRAFIHLVEESLRAAISAIGVDRFGADAMAIVQDALPDELSHVDVWSILWKNRLLGYRAGNRDVFFEGEEPADFEIPLRRAEYVFHPCVIDAVGIKSNGPVPTHSGRGRS